MTDPSSSTLSFFDGEGFDVDLSPPSRSRLRLTFSRGLIPPPSFGHATTSALLGVAIDEVVRGVLVLVVLTLTTGRTVSSSDSASGSTPSAFVPDAGSHVLNLGFGVEARAEAELPECLLGAVQLRHVTAEDAKPFEWWTNFAKPRRMTL